MIKQVYDDCARPNPGRPGDDIAKEIKSMNQTVQLSDLNRFTATPFSPPQRLSFQITKDCLDKIRITRNGETGLWEYEGEPLSDLPMERLLELIEISMETGVHHFWQDHRENLFPGRNPASLSASDMTALFEAVRYDLCLVHIIDEFHGGKI